MEIVKKRLTCPMMMLLSACGQCLQKQVDQKLQMDMHGRAQLLVLPEVEKRPMKHMRETMGSMSCFMLNMPMSRLSKKKTCKTSKNPLVSILVLNDCTSA